MSALVITLVMLGITLICLVWSLAEVRSARRELRRWSDRYD